MKTRNLIVAAIVALTAAGCTPAPEALPVLPSTSAAPTQEQVAPSAPAPESTREEDAPVENAPAPPAQVEAGSARAALDDLVVKGRAPKTGYDRDLFGDGWLDTDGNGCDTRNDVLARDLTDAVQDSDGCTVLSGVLTDPYTATVINFTRGRDTSSDVQIDHMIPLSLAWQQGAQQWDTDKRQAFANDPLNLIAVDGPTNGSKSDSGPGSWLPPNRAYYCAYAARFTAVALKYGASVNPGDHGALVRILDECPDEPLPVDDTVEPPAVSQPGPEPSTAPEPAPAPEVPSGAPAGTDPDYGSCAAAKAAGAAVPYVKGTDPEYDFYRDGDNDGQVCE